MRKVNSNGFAVAICAEDLPALKIDHPAGLHFFGCLNHPTTKGL